MTNAEYKKFLEIAEIGLKIESMFNAHIKDSENDNTYSKIMKERVTDLIFQLNKKISSLEQPLCEACWEYNETKTIGKFLFDEMALCLKCYNRGMLND